MVNQTLKNLVLFILVIALGITAVNQTLGFYYKAHFLKSPCDLCASLNPEVKECIYPSKPSYFVGKNQWTDPFGTYNITINISEVIVP